MSLFGQRPSGLDALLNRPGPSAWQQFLARPCIFLARKLYSWQETIPAHPIADPLSVVCISDAHNNQPALPEGDILIHAAWLRSQPHATKIVVAGNHDQLLDENRDGQTARDPVADRATIDWGDIVYLENSEATIACANGRRLRVYGSPLTPRHGSWAFQYPRTQDVWAGTVPEGIDVLITHGPPCAHLDLMRMGCVHLLRELWRVRPRLRIFGRAHEGTGTEWLQFDALQGSYERTVIAGGGIWNLIRTAREFARGFFRFAVEAKCLLVNAAIVGGLRDDERRQPITVTI